MLTLHVAGAEPVATARLVAGLGSLGVQPNTARQAVWRMTDAGLLAVMRSGRDVAVHRTAEGLAERRAAEDRIARFRADHLARRRGRRRPTPWVTLTVPSLDQRGGEAPQRVRRALQGLGWAVLAPGVWLNVGGHTVEGARTVIDRFQLRGATLGTVEFVAPTDVAGLVGRLWDLPGLADRYRAFVARFAGLQPTDDESRFRDRTAMVAAWATFDDDPVLPPALLPDAWPGIAAQDLIADRYAAWRRGAERWWASLGTT